MCIDNISFIPTFRLFTHYSYGCTTGKKDYMFFEDGLHFSKKGNDCVRNYFLQKFSYYNFRKDNSIPFQIFIHKRQGSHFSRPHFLGINEKINEFNLLKYIPHKFHINHISGVSLIYYNKNFIEYSDSLNLFKLIRSSVKFTRKGREPRETAWFGDIDYRYSSTIQKSNEEWPQPIRDLRSKLEVFLGCSFNSVLCNYYADGSSSIGEHADDEPQLGRYPVIASISLRQNRIFNIIDNTNRATHRIDLLSGSLLVMMGATQLHYKHSMKKTKEKMEPRINLTFRYTHPM